MGKNVVLFYSRRCKISHPQGSREANCPSRRMLGTAIAQMPARLSKFQKKELGDKKNVGKKQKNQAGKEKDSNTNRV
jgi:hypothetical protein